LEREKMIYSEMTIKAMKIAYDSHKNQIDKGGLPYIYHPIHLAEQLTSEAEIVVALLHDVVEDTDWTLEMLTEEGFSINVIEALKLLTHDECVEYLNYIHLLKDSKNEIAIAVKLADLKHNSDLSRVGTADEKAKNRVVKYQQAINILEPELQYDVYTKKTRKRYSLDEKKLHFLSVFYDENGNVDKYSLDVEKANDSHYEIDKDEMAKLIKHLNAELTVALRTYFSSHNQWDFEKMLEDLDVKFKPHHYY
jgi:hypothetical protein